MKTFEDYVKEDKVTEAVYPGMLGVHELFANEDFADWIDKHSKLLDQLSVRELWEKFLKEVKK